MWPDGEIFPRALEGKNTLVFVFTEKAAFVKLLSAGFSPTPLGALFMQSTDLFCKLLSEGNASEGEGQVDPAGGETSVGQVGRAGGPRAKQRPPSPGAVLGLDKQIQELPWEGWRVPVCGARTEPVPGTARPQVPPGPAVGAHHEGGPGTRGRLRALPPPSARAPG